MNRAVFADREQAARVAERLRRDGFEARTALEQFALEDDDADRAWAVVTDAPVVMLELLADELDGWVDHPEDPASRPAPIQLPAQPRRRHRG